MTGGHYSKDDVRVYYRNRQLREADQASFEFVSTGRYWLHMAKDKNQYYDNDRGIDEAEFAARLAKYGGSR